MICWDHPRIRGTNSSRTSSPLMILGSSPHTRDKFYRMPPHNLRTRIIPAYAGQISGVVCHSPGEQDHPRIRGTNQLPFRSRLKRPGSSPHTRDKLADLNACTKKDRIIPAYAGQMLKSLRISSGLEDHPRIRGTNLFPAPKVTSTTGSSPHTRDKCTWQEERGALCRIIPAYAGQILISMKGQSQREDHPRIRGTNACFYRVRYSTLGSSPHTRDKYGVPDIGADTMRIIPAYAGQILPLCCLPAHAQDHPRIRGTNQICDPQG